MAAGQNRMIVCVENTPDAVQLHCADFPPGSAFVLGNESDGISENILALCGMKVMIPQTGLRRCINVSSTAAMLAWEIQRRRLTGESNA